MNELQPLLDNNARWSDGAVARDPEFFKRLQRQQAPEYLWIGCSDSRVPANDIVGLLPGELFVHRNVANVVPHSDVNCQSVIQFAVDALKVKHIMVVGHYGCGGVQVALEGRRIEGVVDYWLGHVRDIAGRYKPLLEAESDPYQRATLLVELNVLEQALNVCYSSVVQDAWARGQSLTVHGWVYSLADGRVRQLGLSASTPEAVKGLRETALERILAAREAHRAARQTRQAGA